MLKSNVPHFFVIVLCLVGTHTMYLSFNQKPVCITIEDQPGKQFKFFYQIIGKEKDNHKVTFIPLNGSLDSYTTSDSKNQTKFSNTSMKICFVSTEKKQKSASIQYYSHDSAQLMELALKTEFYQLHTKLISVGQIIKEIAKNQEFSQIRQTYGSQIIVEQEGRIQKFAFIKIIVIIGVICGQFFLLKSILSKQGQGYHPV